MSRIPKFIVAGIIFIVAASLITHYQYNKIKGPMNAQSTFGLEVAGNTQSGVTSVDGGLVGDAMENAKNYWTTVKEKYNEISSDVTGWVQGDGIFPTGGHNPVSDAEKQQAAAVWSRLSGAVDLPPAISVVPHDATNVSPSEDTNQDIKRRGSLVAEPVQIVSAINRSSPSGEYVANSFAAAAQFLTYGKSSAPVVSITQLSQPIAIAPAAALVSKNNAAEVKEKGNKRLARTESVVSDTPPQSNDPIINAELLKKYSQRANYMRNETSLQKMDDEDDFPKLHVCVNAGEAYGAAWLTTRRHLIYGGVNQFNLTWVNCEMASFTVMGNFRRVMKPTGTGIIMQTLDVLDLSVLHLSTFERSHKRYQAEIWPDRRIRKVAWHNIDPVVHAAAQVEMDVKNRIRYNEQVKPQRSPFAERTIVVMPFLGGAMGAGHSVLSNRYHYLKACFWSIYEFYPHMVMAVTQESDVTWGKEQSGMPWYDVVLLDNLPKSASLPMATVQLTRRMLLSGTWDFDYVYYTESDQILMMRNMESYHQYLNIFPLRVLVPHRLMVYSNTVMEQVHKRTKRSPDPMAKKELLDVIPTKSISSSPNLRSRVVPMDTLNDWRHLSCCMPRQNCMDRDSWIHVNKKDGVPLLNYSGLVIPLGNSNFLMESYRSCKMQPIPLLGELIFCP